ncbi:MAG: glycosyltransferase family 2 protein [Myxococcota bacterium]
MNGSARDMTSGRPLLSVVIVNWNGREDLRRCLDSLREQRRTDFETIVVDNDSNDGSTAMVTHRYPDVVLLDAGANVGFAEGCNIGIRRSRGTWAFMLNPDTVADREWSATLMAYLEGPVPASCGMVQSMLLFMDRPDTINSTGIRLRDIGWGADRQEGAHRTAAAEGPIFCPTAGAAAYRRSMLDAIALEAGYFDPLHFCYLEDLDLGWRARLAGYSAHFLPSSFVHHRYHASTAKRSRHWLRKTSVINHYRTVLKNASRPMLRRSSWRGLLNGIEITATGGAAIPRDIAGALRAGYAARTEVERIRKLDRLEVETIWVGR